MSGKALVERFAELCNRKDIEGLGEVIAVGYRQHNPMIEQGLVGIQNGMRWFLEVFPDLSCTLEDVVEQGDKVAGRFRWRGTHKGPFMGLAATGRTAEWSSMDFWRTQDGKLAEHWDVVDWAGLMQQLQPAGAGAR